MYAKIKKFESMALQDGGGVRCAVFFAGCPLRCVYCHNPETWSGEGEKLSSQQLLEKVRRYKSYFRERGGVTLSGGEPLAQADFCLEFLHLAKEDNIRVALDTSGCIFDEKTKEIIDLCDEVLLDLKFFSDDDYEKFTGKKCLDSVLKTYAYAIKNDKKVKVRTVIVPEINDNENAIKSYVLKLLEMGKGHNSEYELLGFHTMGFSKYDTEGKENPLKNTKALPPQKLQELQKVVDKLYYI